MKQVIVFHSSMCGPCQEYLPRFKRIAVKYRAHAHVRTPDILRSDKRVQDAAVAFKVRATPTTFVLDENDKVLKRKEGGMTDEEIEALFQLATA
jgi:thiol-disulfide isomerase/thioredoxin